jgi:hypothetical protein
MAGTLPGIPLSQQFSAIGQPLAGCLLYIYAANTTTPQDSFLDQGLTIKNPWPLAGDNSGRVPMFYLADGSVHVRLTDSGGVVQFDYPSMLVIGPSTGGGGGGGSVDPTAIFQTGDTIWLDVSGSRTGWVRDNGRTIGNAVSGGSERANADCQALFIFLWNTYADAVCPVTGGRGASGLADFNAGKLITLPDKRGYSPVGDTAMGNADTARLASAPIVQGNATTPGSKVGEATHTLTAGELALHTHSATDAGHDHWLNPSHSTVRLVASAAAGPLADASAGARADLSADKVQSGTANITVASAGGTTPPGGGPANNTQLSVICTCFRKL